MAVILREISIIFHVNFPNCALRGIMLFRSPDCPGLVCAVGFAAVIFLVGSAEGTNTSTCTASGSTDCFVDRFWTSRAPATLFARRRAHRRTPLAVPVNDGPPDALRAGDHGIPERQQQSRVRAEERSHVGH